MATREVLEALMLCDGHRQRQESGRLWPLAAAGGTSSWNVGYVT